MTFMNADFLTVLEFWEREKGISRDVLVAAVEEALLSAAKKAVGPARELRCVIDQKTGDIKAFAKLVDRLADQYSQYVVLPGLKINGRLTLGLAPGGDDRARAGCQPSSSGRVRTAHRRRDTQRRCAEESRPCARELCVRDSG